MNPLTAVYCTILCWSGGEGGEKIKPHIKASTRPQVCGQLTWEPVYGRLGQEREDTAHESWARARGRDDGTQNLLHKEQQVGLQGG